MSKHMNLSSYIRPAWTPVTIAMLIFGFMIHPWLGLAMLAYILWGDRLDMFKDDVSDVTDRVFDSVSSATRGKGKFSRTGNVAFDDWRDAELARLNEKRKELDEMRKEFDDYQRELNRAKDETEFESFLKSRDIKKPTSPKKRVNKK